MRIDSLKQYAKLRQKLLEEKSQLEARLTELNRVLDTEEIQSSASGSAPTVTASQTRRGRRSGNTMSMREAVLAALSKMPLARKEIAPAVEQLGYLFKTKNPLNSIGAILYGKNTPVRSKGGKFYVAGANSAQAAAGTPNGEIPRKKKRKMSAAAKAKIAAAQKARWAMRKAGK